ncbi:MAG: D-tyrosyl-tRNA(Tyr) deacylase [Lentisphaerae bacterium]|nr:D-tyrosyl-tRNA(Tyr) deacylase [Lentisphaerota bacterium]
MKALIQRVARAAVTIGGETAGAAGRGHLVLLGVRDGDSEDDARRLADKTLRLRVFPDDAGKMNRSVCDIGGDILVVSQFTLYADTRKGHRPGFGRAAPPERAEALYNAYVAALRAELGAGRVATGRFGAMMQVELVNDGPVTVELNTD